jgi:MYXO-CTERM domain-containing protein
LQELAQITDAQSYVEYLLNYGYSVFSNSGPFFGPAFSSQILSILDAELPMPSGLAGVGITPNDYYTNISYYLNWHRQENPDLYTDLDLDFDPVALTAELEQRVVLPTREAGRMFRDHPYMTRMFTTLSPHEMNRDPVFSFNDHQLPDVARRHEGTLAYFCGMYSEDPTTTPARFTTEQGWVLEMPDGPGRNNWGSATMPASQFTQILREEGEAQNVLDNSAAIDTAIGVFQPNGGCSISGTGTPGSQGGALVLFLGALGLLFARRRWSASLR